MIARDGGTESPPDPPSGSLPRRVLHAWQLLLGAAFGSTARGARAAGSAAKSAVAGARASVTSIGWDTLRRPAMTAVGIAAVLVGAAGGVALAAPGLDRTSAALAGAASLMWAALRWMFLRLSARAMLAEDPAGLRGAWACGLLAYAVALTPELRFAAWAVSAALTAWAMLHDGRDRREVARAVGLAWGAQAFVVTCGWLARNALVAIVASRG